MNPKIMLDPTLTVPITAKMILIMFFIKEVESGNISKLRPIKQSDNMQVAPEIKAILSILENLPLDISDERRRIISKNELVKYFLKNITTINIVNI